MSIIQTYKCEWCNIMFNDYQSFYNHRCQYTGTGSNQVRFTCKNCHNPFCQGNCLSSFKPTLKTKELKDFTDEEIDQEYKRRRVSKIEEQIKKLQTELEECKKE